MTLQRICVECRKLKLPCNFTCTGSCNKQSRTEYNTYCYCLKHYKEHLLKDEIKNKNCRVNCSILDDETKLRLMFKIVKEET